MANIKKNEKYIPTKNYWIAGIIVVVVILLTWYGFSWYRVYEDNKVAQSYLVKNNVISMEIKDLNEAKDVFQEVPNSYFVFVSYTGDEKVYNMEKEIKDLIKEYKLNDSIYYLNVTDIKNDKNYLDEINNSLSLKDNKITEIPTIVYFKDGKVSKSGIIKPVDGQLMTVNDFQKFLDVNKISKE